MMANFVAGPPHKQRARDPVQQAHHQNGTDQLSFDYTTGDREAET